MLLCIGTKLGVKLLQRLRNMGRIELWRWVRIRGSHLRSSNLLGGLTVLRILLSGRSLLPKSHLSKKLQELMLIGQLRKMPDGLRSNLSNRTVLSTLHILVKEPPSALGEGITLSAARTIRAKSREMISSAMDALHNGLQARSAGMAQNSAPQARDKSRNETTAPTSTAGTTATTTAAANLPKLLLLLLLRLLRLLLLLAARAGLLEW